MSVPSFSSFPDLDEGPSSLSNVSGPSRPRKESKKHSRKQAEHKEKKRKRRDVGRSNGERLDDEQLKAEEDRNRRDVHATSTGNAASLPLYYSDGKGDPLNIRYGGLHVGDIPKHHLVDRGMKILGLDPAWTVFHRSGKGIVVGVGGFHKTHALNDPKTHARLASAPTRTLLPSSNPHKYEETDGFIRLPSRHGRNNDLAYRSITADDPDSDSESSTSEESSASDPDTLLNAYQQTTKSLEQQLNADPSSVDAWLSLLSHSLAPILVTSKNATKARSEISLSILSRALSAHPDNASSVVLRHKYLIAGEGVWHENELNTEWEEALKVGGVELWMEWFEWRIRKGNKGIDGVIEAGTRALAALDDEVSKVRLLWRLAIAFQNAGFVERATALFQAQAELTFNMPQSLVSLSEKAQLNSLEEFWESRFPLLGEPDSKGWSNWLSSGQPEGESGSTNPTVPTSESNTDPYIQWSVLESREDRCLRLPSRSDDEVDPYATILFSDIRPLLISLRSANARNVFRLIWLSVLGLHVPGFSESLSANRRQNMDDRWCYTHLTSAPYLGALFPSETQQRRILTDAYAGVVIGRKKEYASGFGPVKNWGYGTVDPLECLRDGQGGFWVKEDVQSVDVPFIRCVFAQLRSERNDCEWDKLALAFEAAVNTKSALKLSRSFLSTARDSMAHWAVHARLERLRGRPADARKVYQTVLVESRSTNEIGTSQLWWDWAELEWLSGNTNEALQVIARSAGVEGTSLISSLRAKQNLKEALTTLPEARWQEREALTKLLALLELLIGSLDSANLVFGNNLSDLKNGTIPHESLTMAHLMMLYRHRVVLNNPAPPSVWRNEVNKAVENYPNNTIILGMLLEAEKGQGIWGRVRELLGEGTASGAMKDKDVARRVMEVWIAGWERGRWEGEKERTRSGLAAAIENERTKNSATIWRVFIEFEIRAGQMQRAKKMLFRAIGECPLVKELYLMAFGTLRSVFSASELNAFSDAMAERGIRMRRGIEEFLEGWVEEGAEDEEGDDSGDDEMEYDSKELRRLLPY